MVFPFLHGSNVFPGRSDTTTNGNLVAQQMSNGDAATQAMFSFPRLEPGATKGIRGGIVLTANNTGNIGSPFPI
jgi:hypothetical protein